MPLLFDNEPRFDDPTFPWERHLNMACAYGKVPLVQHLLGLLDQNPALGDPNLPWEHPQATDPGTPLNVAIAYDRADLAILLAQHPRVDVNVPNDYGVAPLLNAVAMNVDPGRRGSNGEPLPGVLDVVTALLNAGAQQPAPMEVHYALPMGLGHTMSLADRTCHDGGHSAPAILDRLVDRGWLVPTPEVLRRLLVITIGRSLAVVSNDLTISLPPFAATLDWLLDRHAPTDHMDPATGQGVIEVAQGWRDRAPHAFARLEQAVLRADPRHARPVDPRVRPRL